MAAVQPGDQMEHQLVLALQHVRVSAAANAELGAENVRLRELRHPPRRPVLALTIALRSKDVQLRATTAEIPALEQQLAALASQPRRRRRRRPGSRHGVAGHAGGRRGGRRAGGGRGKARVCRGGARKAAGGSGGGGCTRGSTRPRARRRARGGGTSRGGGHGGHGGGHCGGVVRGDDRGGGGSAGRLASRERRRRVRSLPRRLLHVPRKRSAAPCDSHWRRTRRRRSRRRLPRRRRRARRRYHRHPRPPPLERPVWRVGFLAPPKSAPAVPWRLQIASPLGVSSEPEPTFAPEAGPVLPAAPRREQPSGVS